MYMFNINRQYIQPIGRVQKIAVEKCRPSSSQVFKGRSAVTFWLAPLSLTSQVPDQWNFTGGTPEWSDSGEPARK